jgi:type 2 lantibiotic biosynthesis protein LanM
MHWREERRADIARTRKLAAPSAVEPPWWREFWRCYRTNTASTPETGFLAALGPLIAAKTATLRAQLSGGGCSLYPGSEKSLQELSASFEEALRDRLALAVTKTLVLELAVAGRVRLLKGDTPEARFAFFCECLKDPGFAARLLGQYPVLVRRCIAIASVWEAASRSLLARLAASEAKLISTFFDNKHPGPLTSVEASGDVHGRGQATHVLTFESGAKLVYKPRPIAMERCYYDLIAWLSDRGLDPELRVVRTLDEGAFGWMEFVPVAPCGTRAQVNRFFVRMGAHLALTSLLGGTDLHSENVIAHGEHAVPVDLETLFHADLMPENLSGATARGWAVLRHSVVHTLILPEARGFSDKPDDWVDMSALGHRDNQLTPIPVANWARAETDRMRLIYKRATIPRGFSVPEFAGQRVQSAAYADDVVHGFGQTYELLRRFKTELLAPQGPLSAFAGKPSRRVFRDTTIYALTLFASCHPRFQRDAIACEAMLRDALRATPDGQPWLKRLEDAEVEDLLACDIPYFVSTVGSPDVRAIGGQAAIALAGDAEHRARIEAMNGRDLERQEWLIRVAMQDPEEEGATTPMPVSSSLCASSPETLIATAARIGDRLCELAIEDGDGCTWLVPELVNSRRLATTVAGFGLYDGLSGIALFLGHLSAITGEGRYGGMADAAMREARALCRKQHVSSARLGAFQDIGGFCYALVHLAALTGRRELAAEASAIIHKFATRAARTGDLDLITGVAGFVVAGLVVARFNRDKALVENLRSAVERLYRLTTSPPRPLPILAENETGLAHGRAGAALALFRWAETTGEARFRTAGEDLVRKDFAIMEASRRNASATNAAEHPADYLGWCRGGVGIAMAALATHPPVIGLFDATWAKGLAQEMARSRPSRPLCLCHGALGRLEFLSFAGRRLFGDDHMKELEAWRAALLGEIVGGHWVADWAHALESPGFMLGLAGTGYSLLRQAASHRVPSVLLLEDAAISQR